MRKIIVTVLSLMVVATSSVMSFADTVTATVKAGEHGTVNGKTGEFTETPEAGKDYTLKVKADEGYVIDKIIVNGDEDEAEMEKLAGKSEFETIAEKLSTDIEVEFTFKKGIDPSPVLKVNGANTYEAQKTDELTYTLEFTITSVDMQIIDALPDVMEFVETPEGATVKDNTMTYNLKSAQNDFGQKKTITYKVKMKNVDKVSEIPNTVNCNGTTSNEVIVKLPSSSTSTPVTDDKNDNQQTKSEFKIKVTSEGPGTVFTVFETNEGTYTSDSSEEDRTISWAADTDAGASVKSVTINGKEDKTRTGKLADSYVAQTGDAIIHIIFAKEEEAPQTVYTVTTTAGEGGFITDSFTYSTGEQEVKYEADDGYAVDKVIVNGKESEDKSGVVKFSEGDQTIDVTFKSIENSTEPTDVNSDEPTDVNSDEPTDVDSGKPADINEPTIVKTDDTKSAETKAAKVSEAKAAKTSEVKAAESSEKPNAKADNSKSKSNAVNTGDKTSAVLYVSVLILSAILLATLKLKRQSTTRHLG